MIILQPAKKQKIFSHCAQLPAFNRKTCVNQSNDKMISNQVSMFTASSYVITMRDYVSHECCCAILCSGGVTARVVAAEWECKKTMYR